MARESSQATALVLFILLLVMDHSDRDLKEEAVPALKISSASVRLNVKDFGAKGDGKTNDTAALQKVFTRASGGGQTVYFPKGIYLVDSTKDLIIPAGTTVTGDGGNSVLKASTNSFGWELLRAAGSDISVSRLTLDGNNQVNRVLVVAGGSQRVSLSGLTVANASQNRNPGSEGYGEVVCGIVIYGDTKQIMVDGVEVKNIVAINSRSGDPIARGIYVTTTWGSKEKVAQVVMIQNCYIHDIGPADDGDGIYFEDPGMDNGSGQRSDSVISGNTMDHVAKRGIKVYAEGVVVKSNHITNSYLNNNKYVSGADKGQLAPDMYAAISLYGSHLSAENNTIDGTGSYYAAIEVAAGSQVSDISIKGNRIAMGANSRIQGTTAIRLGSISDFNVSGNTINRGERGIWTWQNAADGRITGNEIVVPQGGGIDLTTYLKGYIQQNIIVENNKIKAGTFTIQQGASNRNVTVRT